MSVTGTQDGRPLNHAFLQRLDGNGTAGRWPPGDTAARWKELSSGLLEAPSVRGLVFGRAAPCPTMSTLGSSCYREGSWLRAHDRRGVPREENLRSPRLSPSLTESGKQCPYKLGSVRVGPANRSQPSWDTLLGRFCGPWERLMCGRDSVAHSRRGGSADKHRGPPDAGQPLLLTSSHTRSSTCRPPSPAHARVRTQAAAELRSSLLLTTPTTHSQPQILLQQRPKSLEIVCRLRRSDHRRGWGGRRGDTTSHP